MLPLMFLPIKKRGEKPEEDVPSAEDGTLTFT